VCVCVDDFMKTTMTSVPRLIEMRAIALKAGPSQAKHVSEKFATPGAMRKKTYTTARP
jgi:hypothetical protein